MDAMGIPAVWEHHFLLAVLAQPSRPPGVCAVGDDVVRGTAHQKKIVERIASHVPEVDEEVGACILDSTLAVLSVGCIEHG
jgi:hypothetical protein